MNGSYQLYEKCCSWRKWVVLGWHVAPYPVPVFASHIASGMAFCTLMQILQEVKYIEVIINSIF